MPKQHRGPPLAWRSRHAPSIAASRNVQDGPEIMPGKECLASSGSPRSVQGNDSGDSQVLQAGPRMIPREGSRACGKRAAGPQRRLWGGGGFEVMECWPYEATEIPARPYHHDSKANYREQEHQKAPEMMAFQAFEGRGEGDQADQRRDDDHGVHADPLPVA